MEAEEATPKRRRFIWIWAAVALVVIGGAVWITHEPASPFAFLNKYEVAEKRTSKDGKLRILVLKANTDEVWKGIQSYFAGQSISTQTGYMNINGKSSEYMSIGTAEGIIQVSNDLTFANDGLNTSMRMQDVRPGYCAVAFTRPPTIFDRILDWVHNHMGGGGKPPQQEAAPSPPTIRV